MPKIPLVGEPEGVEPGQTFQPTSVTTFDKVGQAGARLGESVEGVAGDLPERIKQGIDLGALAKADTARNAHFQGFQDSLQDGTNEANNDPHTFQQRWNDSQAGFSEALSNDPAIKGLSFQARRQFQVDQARWQTSTNQAVGHMATEKALNNAVGDIKTAYEQQLMIGDEDAQDVAQGLVQKGMATGLLNPEEGKQMILQIPMKAEYNQAVKMMGMDPDTGGGPIVLEKALKEQNADGSFKNYPHVVGQAREAITFDAYRNARFLQAETAQDYAAQQASGQQIDPDKAAHDLKLGKISEAQYKALVKPGSEFNEGVYSDMATAIQKYDPRTDPNHTKSANMLASINEAKKYLPPSAVSDLLEQFKKQSDPKAPYNTQAAKRVFAANQQMFEQGGFGRFEYTKPGVFDKKTGETSKEEKIFLPNVQTNAAIKRAKVDKEIRDTIDQNPGVENDEEALMKVYQFAVQANRGSTGAQMFTPPTFTPSAPTGP